MSCHFPLVVLPPPLPLLLLLVQLATFADGGGGGGGGGRGDTSVVLEGSPTSYAQFRPWRGGANSTLELEFSVAHGQRDGLLLYADSRATGEYLLLSLVGGAARLLFNWGAGRRGMLTAGRNLAPAGDRATDDGVKRAWHHALVLNGGGETSLVVDRVYRASTSFGKKDLKGLKKGERPGYFAASGGNRSYVYVGGLPSWYADRSELLAQPLALLEPRLRGAVRNLRYSAAGSSSSDGGGGGGGGRSKGSSRGDRKRSKKKEKGGKKKGKRTRGGEGGGGGGGSEAVQEMMAYKVRT